MRGKLRKRWYLLFLLVFLTGLLIFSDEIGRLMYPMKYKQEIALQAEQHNISPYLIAAIIRVESNYKPDRISAKNATGLMQIMPSTAEWIAEMTQIDTNIQLLEPSVNIQLGSWYLYAIKKELSPYLKHKSDQDRISIIASSYNAGPAKVKSWINNEVWTGTADEIKNIPFGETRHYVQRVLYYYKKYKQFYVSIEE